MRLVDTSGNTAAFDTSGRVTIAGGSITASISGEPVKISGETVIAKVSGETVISNVSGNIVTAKISGETVISTVSGNVIVTSVSGNAVNLSGQGVWVSGTVITSISGNAVIFSGQGVWVSGSVSISGNAVTSSGDTHIAKVSGEPIVVTSGAKVILLNVAGTSGLSTPSFGSDSITAANQYGLAIQALTYGFTDFNAGMARSRLAPSGAAVSGIGYRLVTDFSGAVATVSGNTVNNAAQTITTPAWLTITGNSGGTTLAAQACTMVRIQNLSGNGTMLVGGIGTAAPVSGTKGIALWPSALSTIGTELDFPVSNANLISVVAHTSGNQVAYMTFG